MKQPLAIIVTALVLTGCMTANMLEAERSYYQAAVQLQQARSAQPLFELTPAKAGEPITLGNACSFTLILTNGGSKTQTWPVSVDWPGGTAPTLTSSGVDVLTFVTINAGTTWMGFLAGGDLK